MSGHSQNFEKSHNNNNQSSYHIPVMLAECLKYLNVVPGGVYVDATLGGGGHTTAILKMGGKVIAFDQDPDAIKRANDHLEDYIANGQLQVIQSNFRHMLSFIQATEDKAVDGILLDLGVSSHQIDEPARGFAFGKDGPLDMRMHQGTNITDGLSPSLTAEVIVNDWSDEDIANILYYYGDEKRSRRIAREIVTNRPLKTTAELEKVISRVTSFKERQKTLARCFQALRIKVNDELGALEDVLANARDCLKPGGRLVVMSYHSLEDRRVKRFMKTGKVLLDEDDEDDTDKTSSADSGWEIVTKRAIVPNDEEQSANRRSRSAKLRCAAKSVSVLPNQELNGQVKKTGINTRTSKFLGAKQLRKLLKQAGEESSSS